ncbi:hypothetical protein P3S67_022658 [Capsicum chacoense]
MKHRHDTPILEEETSHTVESSPASPSPNTSLVKPIRYLDYSFKTLIERYPSLIGYVNVKSGLGKSFSEFRNILEDKKLTKFFKSSIFGKYLNLPNNINIRFQMNLVYQLLQRKIISHRKEKVWINYYGMPVCFGMREFAIITGLNCHLSVVYDEEKMSTKTLRRRQQIIDLVGKTCKEKELIEHIRSEDVRKSVKKSLCLLYFVHNFLCAKDLNMKLPSEWVLLSANRDAFSAYPWGRVSYDLTIQYLLKAVNPNVKTFNLYGFSLAFMVIPPLRKKFKVFSEEISLPRTLRWLSATNNISIEINELFDPPPPKDSIVHPWIIPTSSEMEVDFLTKFLPLQLTKDDKIEKLERDLNGVAPIKRDYIVVEGDLDPSRAVVVGGSVVGDGGGSYSPNVDIGTSGIGGRGGEGSSPFVTSGLGGFSGDFGVGRSPINENISRPQEIPSPLRFLLVKFIMKR